MGGVKAALGKDVPEVSAVDAEMPADGIDRGRDLVLSLNQGGNETFHDLVGQGRR
jgi:hypothetical protein